MAESSLSRRAKRLLCEVREEEYHWLFHEILLSSLMRWWFENQHLPRLEKSLRNGFTELSQYGGLFKGDYSRRNCKSIVSHNLILRGIWMIVSSSSESGIILPDGDNGFYTDENEGGGSSLDKQSKGMLMIFIREKRWNPTSLLPFSIWSREPGKTWIVFSWTTSIHGFQSPSGETSS